MGVRILIGHKHFRHGYLVGNGSKSLLVHVANIIEDGALSRIKAKVELPTLPIDLTAAHTEIAAF